MIFSKQTRICCKYLIKKKGRYKITLKDWSYSSLFLQIQNLLFFRQLFITIA